MTAPSSWFTYRPVRRFDLQAPSIDAADVSIVIPVRNNPSGLSDLLASIRRLHRQPLEVLVVDNLSEPPIQLPNYCVTTRLLHCKTPGAAAARNAGVRAAKGTWIWFLDSDCEVMHDTLERFMACPPGPIALCGRVTSAHRRLLGRYYEDQEILIPQFAENDEPLYLVTASAMVFRTALEAVDYFDERFPSAAGEDIDLGLRLFARGRIAFVKDARVTHKFEECLKSFRSRFTRYGEGTRVLAEKYGISLAPTPFQPARQTRFAVKLAQIQYESLLRGYSSPSSFGAQTGISSDSTQRRWLAKVGTTLNP